MKMETKLKKLLFQMHFFVLIFGFITLNNTGSIVIAKSDKICIEKKFDEAVYKECASRSLVERDLPLTALKSLIISEQKRRIKQIKTKYDLVDYKTSNLSKKWNRIIGDISDTLSPTIRTDVNSIDSLLGSVDLLEIKKSQPDFYNFLIKSFFQCIESAPPMIYREEKGQIIVENDPMFTLLPLLFGKMIEYLKRNGQLDDIQEEMIKAQIDKQLLEIMSFYTKTTKYMYPVQYDQLVMSIACKELNKLYASVKKKVFIISNTSFVGARSDHVGNLLLSQNFIQNMEDNTLDAIMAHEAIHLLRDNTNPIIVFLLDRYSKRWSSSIKSIIGEIAEGQDGLNTAQIDSQIKEMKNLLKSSQFEINIDIEVLEYYNKKPLIREKYANALASFETVSMDRLEVINAVNECINKGKADFQAFFAFEEGKFRDKSPILSMTECSKRLKVALKEYFKRKTNQIMGRAHTNGAKLFLQSIENEFLEK